MQLCLVDGGANLTVVENGHVYADTSSEIEIGFQLGSPCIAAHRGGVGGDASISADGRHAACLGHLHAEVAALHTEHRIFNLWTVGEGGIIHALEGGNGLQGHFVCGFRDDHVKRFIVGKLE